MSIVPLYLVKLKPLSLDMGCRLTRRFGPDRFFEILIPSPTSMSTSVPATVNRFHWLSRSTTRVEWTISLPDFYFHAPRPMLPLSGDQSLVLVCSMSHPPSPWVPTANLEEETRWYRRNHPVVYEGSAFPRRTSVARFLCQRCRAFLNLTDT